MTIRLYALVECIDYNICKILLNPIKKIKDKIQRNVLTINLGKKFRESTDSKSSIKLPPEPCNGLVTNKNK